MSVGVVILVVFSVMRGTRLVTFDALTDGFWLRRVNNLARFPKLQAWFTKLITCAWCASIWVGPLVTVPAYFYGDAAWFVIPAVVLLASQVTGLSAQWLDPGRRDWAGD